MSWPNISDQEIGVGATFPDTSVRCSSELFGKLRERDRRASCVFAMDSTKTFVRYQTTNNQWIRFGGESFTVMVPTWAAGDAGSRLTVHATISLERDYGRSTDRGSFRMCLNDYTEVSNVRDLTLAYTPGTASTSLDTYFELYFARTGMLKISFDVNTSRTATDPDILGPVAQIVIASTLGPAHRLEAWPR